MNNISENRLPELLSPAGSLKALEAAIDGGADAVYFGASSFNARIGAENFSETSLERAIDLCHTYGVKAYLTLNTLVYDRELANYLKTAEMAYKKGIDALIVADLGGAALLHRELPELPLHASTQMSGHNVEAATLLASLGFSRMVLARETPEKDIKIFVEKSPIEAEVFIHGALCVSHSGQCLFSSLVGGRSGNRGECAQPCRLPYGSKNNYPLSLRDLCLAKHIPTLIDYGVASLKIEGRMKSPEYVREVTAIYRSLLDRRCGASDYEMRELASIFSRDGFTDGYFTSSISRSMLGTRSEKDKQASRKLVPFDKITRKIPITLTAEFYPNSPSSLTLSMGDVCVTAKGETPMAAINVPMTEEIVSKNLTKFGNTPFAVEKIKITVCDGLMLPVSSLNSLRREATAMLIAALTDTAKRDISVSYNIARHSLHSEYKAIKSAHFFRADMLTKKSLLYFDRIYMPLGEFCDKFNKISADIKFTDGKTEYGVALPPVIFDSERAEACLSAKKAADLGAKYALVENVGQLQVAKEAGLIPVADFRFNICNSESAQMCDELGFESFILSPELTLPRMRDIINLKAGGSAIVYGRIPLMLLEKCVTKEVGGCSSCGTDKASLVDRKGVAFPILREAKHRSVVCNSLPTFMADKQSLLSKYAIRSHHFIFTVENKTEVDRVIESYRKGLSADEIGLFSVRRISE